VWFLTASSNAVLRIFGDRTSFTEARLSPEELQQLLEEATRTGSIDPDAGNIASRAIDFGELTAAEVMVPRNRVVAIDRALKPEELRRVLLEEGHSRMPVYEETIDNVVGYISIKDVIALAWEQQLIVLEDLIRPAYFVPETMNATDLLREMQARRIAIAVVVEESGGMAGIVTTEDLAEELVGELFSEQDEPVPEAVHREPDGSALVQAIAPIREVNRALDLDLPEGDGWTTVAGLCIQLAGRIPEKGARLETQDHTVLEVLEASARRVRLVRIVPPRNGADESQQST
jgi:putative hemolysin